MDVHICRDEAVPGAIISGEKRDSFATELGLRSLYPVATQSQQADAALPQRGEVGLQSQIGQDLHRRRHGTRFGLKDRR